MKILELFAGTRSIGKAFEAKGHEVFSVEWDKDFENINLYADINTIAAEDILQKFGRPDVIWASPDCATFSIAAISHHRRKNPETGNLDPVSDYAKFCDEVDQHVLQLIEELNPTFYFIENPRGGMRKMTWMQGLPRYTVTYCQYGDTRMKPTDIWTNHPDPQFKPMCKNGDSCHVPAPRGSHTPGSSQGLKNSKERSIIPEALCQHIVDICEKHIKEKEKNMELKVKTPTFPEVIEFNFEELKQEITERASAYVNLVYTDDQISDAKKDRATLNKFVKALSDERIKIKKECLKPYEDFEVKIKELDGIVNKAIQNIDSQVKAYEEQLKADKLAAITGYWKSCEKPFEIDIEKVLDQKWLNASVSLKSVYGAIDALLEKVNSDLSALQNLPEFSFEAVEVYKTTLDLGKAISEGQRLSEIQKRKEEAERQRAEREAELERQKAEAAQHMIPPAEKPPVEDLPTEPMKEWISFKALLTVDDAQALKDFFESRNIVFEAI